jgi:Fe-S-cluster containining protein
MRRKLPIFVERSIQQVQADRVELTDRFEHPLKGEVVFSCSAGCAACCYHPALISILEAIPLYGALVDRGNWTASFKEKLTTVSKTTLGLSFEVWLLSKIACPLLDDNRRCMVYEARPFMCRTVVATGDPRYCDSQRLGNETTILPRKGVMQEFHAREKLLLRRHGLSHLTMPIGQAVLMAEKVCSGSVTLEGIDRAYYLEHLANE